MRFVTLMTIVSNSTEVFRVLFDVYQKKQKVKNRATLGKILTRFPISAECEMTANAACLIQTK